MLDLKRLGENIRKERKRQLLTIEQLAELAGITENFLGKIERGDSVPSLPTMDSIAHALNVGIDYLSGQTERPIEYHYINSLMELNELTPENKERFLDFISANIRYFK